MPRRLARGYFLAVGHQPIRSARKRNVLSPFKVARTDFPIQTLYGLRPSLPIDGRPSLLRHPIAQTSSRQYRNMNLFPITYAFQPRLRGRLTLGGRTFPRKSRDYGGRDSHPTFRYSCPHNHFHAVHPSFRTNFKPHGTLSYHSPVNG